MFRTLMTKLRARIILRSALRSSKHGMKYTALRLEKKAQKVQAQLTKLEEAKHLKLQEWSRLEHQRNLLLEHQEQPLPLELTTLQQYLQAKEQEKERQLQAAIQLLNQQQERQQDLQTFRQVLDQSLTQLSLPSSMLRPKE